MTFGERVKARRLELGYTLLQLAEKIGVTEATMQRYESGSIKNPAQPRIAALAQALGVDANYLMAWGQDDETNPQGAPQVQPVPELANAYFRFAKDAEKNGIDPRDIEMAIKMIRQLRSGDNTDA